ncbi:MAG: tRNA 2-thiouridine synthesizing protein A [Lentisphaeria bacterium]|jgi:tRNA 2-thiouridine synthesizing protein A
MFFNVSKQVDASGLICPEPIMLLHAAVRDAQTGDIIELKATDPSSRRDVTSFCDFLGHQLEGLTEVDDVLVFYIKKG